jgi:hypothetical protein
MKKAFDCVEMKRKAQARIFAETRGLDPDEELAYFHRAADECRAELGRLRADILSGRRMPPVAAGR